MKIPEKLIIEINLGNAAFDPDWQHEVRMILSGLVNDFAFPDEVERGDEITRVPLRDANGNEVGYVGVTNMDIETR